MFRLGEILEQFGSNRRDKAAIALAYDHIGAPVLKAKGKGSVAAEIIDIARSKGILIAKDPVLVEALSALELDEEIPEELYQSVAVILSWVYWIQGKSPKSTTVT